MIRKEASCCIIVQWTILGFGEKNRLGVKGIFQRWKEKGTHTPLFKLVKEIIMVSMVSFHPSDLHSHTY